METRFYRQCSKELDRLFFPLRCDECIQGQRVSLLFPEWNAIGKIENNFTDDPKSPFVICIQRS